MAIQNPSKIVSFDGDAAVDAARETVSGTLFSIVEYDTTEFQPLYVEDVTLSFYGGEAEMEAHFGQIHGHVNLDFTEIELFVEDLFPIADGVQAITTRMDYMKVIRLYGDREGLFVAVETDEPVTPLVDALLSIVHGAQGSG